MLTLKKTKIKLAVLSVFTAVVAVAAISGLNNSQLLVRANAQSIKSTATTIEQGKQVNDKSGSDNEIAKPEKNNESAIENPEGKSQENDLSGGHQDSNDINVDHQFNGAE
ncbi:MAG: hypothetical protein M1334_04140 [Patescibacteria group bacterium]|nr:hypothetical protein [Patescibacteria group bacterium]